MSILNIVLVEPRIPQNVGNIARTCAATGARLHLVEPMAFTIDDTKLKRAGLDYWKYLDVTTYPSLVDFMERHKDEQEKMYYFTTKAQHISAFQAVTTRTAGCFLGGRMPGCRRSCWCSILPGACGSRCGRDCAV